VVRKSWQLSEKVKNWGIFEDLSKNSDICQLFVQQRFLEHYYFI
jgi:hypothetical protein